MPRQLQVMAVLSVCSRVDTELCCCSPRRGCAGCVHSRTQRGGSGARSDMGNFVIQGSNRAGCESDDGEIINDGDFTNGEILPRVRC